MATTKRNFPNDYFAWYNDDDRLAIVARVLTNDVSDSTETTLDKYDTYTDSSVTNGIRITFHSKYEEVTSTSHDLKTHAGLDSALHNAVLCYVKSRLYEDDEDLEYSQYFRAMYEQKIKNIEEESLVFDF